MTHIDETLERRALLMDKEKEAEGEQILKIPDRDDFDRQNGHNGGWVGNVNDQTGQATAEENDPHGIAGRMSRPAWILRVESSTLFIPISKSMIHNEIRF